MSKQTLKPLTCSTCSAPVPLGEADDVVCPSCGARQPLPGEYRTFRAARRLSAEDAKTLEALAADIGQADPVWKKVLVWVGYAVGGVTCVVLAVGALLGAIAGLVVASKADDSTIVTVIVGLCAIAAGLASVPFVGEVLVRALQYNFDVGYTLATGADTQLEIDLWVGAGLYLLGIVPLGIAWRTQESLKAVNALRAQLSAQPSLKGGALGCRECGAPLTVPEGALAARCVYCGTDNLVAVTRADADVARSKAGKLRRAVREALDAHRETQADDRRTMATVLVLGVFLVPIVCLGGLLLHAVASG